MNLKQRKPDQRPTWIIFDISISLLQNKENYLRSCFMSVMVTSFGLYSHMEKIKYISISTICYFQILLEEKMIPQIDQKSTLCQPYAGLNQIFQWFYDQGMKTDHRSLFAKPKQQNYLVIYFVISLTHFKRMMIVDKPLYYDKANGLPILINKVILQWEDINSCRYAMSLFYSTFPSHITSAPNCKTRLLTAMLLIPIYREITWILTWIVRYTLGYGCLCKESLKRVLNC